MVMDNDSGHLEHLAAESPVFFVFSVQSVRGVGFCNAFTEQSVDKRTSRVGSSLDKSELSARVADLLWTSNLKTANKVQTQSSPVCPLQECDEVSSRSSG